MAAPPLVSDAGKKKKFPLEGPAISTANVLSMMASFVSYRQRMAHLAAEASSATVVRLAGILRPRGFQVRIGHNVSLIDDRGEHVEGRTRRARNASSNAAS
jgi:hypothetical protein